MTRLRPAFHSCHRRRNRGGKGGACPPTLQGGGGRRGSLPPHFWAHTYLKVPPRSLFFPPHNSMVLTPNQSVRCFKKFIDVGTGGEGPRLPHVFPVRGGKPGPPCWKLLRASFSVSSDIIFCVISACISLRTYPRAFQMQEARSPAYFTHYTNLFGSLSHQALARDS